MLRILRVDIIDILIDSIRCAQIALSAISACRQQGNLHWIAAISYLPSSPVSDMIMKRFRLILRQDANGIDPRMNAIAQRVVNNSTAPSKGYGGFRD